MRRNGLGERGFVLIVTTMMLAVVMTMLSAYFVTTEIEIATTKSSKNSLTGFYAAEAGLNLRAEEIRNTFIGYNRPDGTSPSTSTPCEAGDDGSGDFACQALVLGKQSVAHFVNEEPGNPISLTIPPGELYQNLNAQEYRYTVNSKSKSPDDRVEAILELRFKSRLVPLFQFAAFYNKDLEILPGPLMTLAGPVHTNGDLYLDAGNTLNIQGQVTTGGSLFRGRKNNSTCKSNPVNVDDPSTPVPLLPSCSSRTELFNPDLTAWNGMVEVGVEEVTVPEPEVFDPVPGATYWDKADLRLVLNLDSSNNPVTTVASTGVEVRDASDAVEVTKTNDFNNTSTCPGSINETSAGANDGNVAAFSNTFYSNREGATILMLDFDMQALLNCLHNTNFFGEGKLLDDDTEGGLVFHLTVKGPDSADPQSNYGVRVRNASELQSNVVGAPAVRGLSLVTDQAIFTYGDYNQDLATKIPASIMADAFNVLSSVWDDGNSTNWSARIPVDTVIRAAVLSGTDTTGGLEGIGGQGGSYNGGLENYPRFHEQWAKSPKKTLTYRGSFVSLDNSRHSDGAWSYGSPQYTAPTRDWGFDTDFNSAENLPPLSPRFVYLRQELFVRSYEQ